MAESPIISHADLLSHAPALAHYARARLRDQATAEDLVQETLVTAVTQLQTFQGQSALRTWLIGILRHKILDHFRWQKRHPGDLPQREPGEDGGDRWFLPEGSWRLDPTAGLHALNADPQQILENTQLRADLARCMDKLSPALHRAFVLREVDQCDPGEICAMTGISRESLAVTLYRARTGLRACLQAAWGTP